MTLTIQINQIQKDFFYYSDYQDFQSRSKQNYFSIESTSKRVNFSTEALFEEVAPVVTQKYEFECEHNSKITAIFEFLDNQDYNARNKIDNFWSECFATN